MIYSRFHLTHRASRLRNRYNKAHFYAYTSVYTNHGPKALYICRRCRRLSPVYLNTSKEMEMYLDDSSSEKKIIWHILKVGISLKLLKPPPVSSLSRLSWKKEGSEDTRGEPHGYGRVRTNFKTIFTDKSVCVCVCVYMYAYINWRFTKTYDQNFSLATCSCSIRY